MNHPERVSNTDFFSYMYNWNGIEFPAGKKDLKRFERNNKKVALNILYVPHDEKKKKKSCI